MKVVEFPAEDSLTSTISYSRIMNQTTSNCFLSLPLHPLFFLTAHAPYCLPYYMPTHLIHININIITFEVQTINSSVYGVNAAQCWYKYRDCRR